MTYKIKPLFYINTVLYLLIYSILWKGKIEYLKILIKKYYVGVFRFLAIFFKFVSVQTSLPNSFIKLYVKFLQYCTVLYWRYWGPDFFLGHIAFVIYFTLLFYRTWGITILRIFPTFQQLTILKHLCLTDIKLDILFLQQHFSLVLQHFSVMAD